ncbi:MAG: hypothetical protein K940chlam3_01676 [Chlamydiae bacterium]|nr:hypothetical protein [Chlamydiota bacterium]
MSLEISSSPVFLTMVNCGRDPDLRLKVWEEAEPSFGIQNYDKNSICCHVSKAALKVIQQTGCRTLIIRRVPVQN